jgi:regulation of enolase protein 1 (concanavalin A-like superfamily)
LSFVTASGLNAQSLPVGWQSADVGDVGTPGSAIQENGTWLVTGAGADIWGPADAFHYAFTPVGGDADIYALVNSEQPTHQFAKAGLMIRQGLDSSYGHVLIDVKPDGGIEVLTRRLFQTDTTFVAGVQAELPVWLKLSHTGQKVAVYYASASACPVDTSTCGSWTLVAADIPFSAGRPLLGLAVTSHDPNATNTAQFSSVHTTQLTLPWSQGDFFAAGAVSPAAWSRDGVFYVPGVGTDIWDTADDFEFVARRGRGDSEIVARVVTLDDTSPFAKAGVMMRADRNPSSAHVILDVKPDGGIEFMTRTAAGESTAFIAGAAASLPVWLRLTRHDDQVEGSLSNDGQNWTSIGSAALTLSSPDYSVGLAATSHNPDQVSNSKFDNVSVAGLFREFDGPDLLSNGGFEDGQSGVVSSPWISDRDVPAVVEMAHPHSGARNGACRGTDSGDCGVYQEITVPHAGDWIIRFFANAESSGVLAGITYRDDKTIAGTVDVLEPGNYQPFGIGVHLSPTDSRVIRVWLYVPAGGGAVIDDVTLTSYSGPT